MIGVSSKTPRDDRMTTGGFDSPHIPKTTHICESASKPLSVQQN